MGGRARGHSIARVGAACAAAALLGASPAQAGECTVNTFELRSELRFPTYTGGTSGFDQPFATVLQTLLSIEQTGGCGGSCPSNPSIGESQCGDLVTAPIDVAEVVAGLTVNEYNGYEARLLANGKWEYRADVLLEAPASGARFANSNVSFGHREVFDVTSAASDPQPLRLRLRESGVLPSGPQSCPGFWRPIPDRTRYLRVRAQGVTPFLLDEVLGPPDHVVIQPGDVGYERVINDWDFDLEVPPNTVLYVDLLYDPIGGTYQSPVTDFLTGLDCEVTLVLSQWIEPNGGIQLFVSPGPALLAVPRSGIAYEPVPEPGSLASGAAALAALTWRRRRSLRVRRSTATAVSRPRTQPGAASLTGATSAPP